MRQEYIRVICDNCQKEENVSRDVVFGKKLCSGGWYILSKITWLKEDEKHFCSLQCLNEWTQNRLKILCKFKK